MDQSCTENRPRDAATLQPWRGIGSSDKEAGMVPLKQSASDGQRQEQQAQTRCQATMLLQRQKPKYWSKMNPLRQRCGNAAATLRQRC